MGYEDERDKIRSNRTTSKYTQYIDEEEVRSDEVAAVLRSPKLVQTPVFEPRGFGAAQMLIFNREEVNPENHSSQRRQLHFKTGRAAIWAFDNFNVGIDFARTSKF